MTDRRGSPYPRDLVGYGKNLPDPAKAPRAQPEQRSLTLPATRRYVFIGAAALVRLPGSAACRPGRAG